MDDANLRAMQEPNPTAAAGVDPNAPAEGDWRAQLQPGARGRIVNEIVETMKKHVPLSEHEGLDVLQRTAVILEEKIYSVATNLGDYLRKLSLKILCNKETSCSWKCSSDPKSKQPRSRSKIISAAPDSPAMSTRSKKRAAPNTQPMATRSKKKLKL